MIGREFSFELLEAVVSLPAGTLNEQFSRLVDAEILPERGHFPHKRHVFKHALVQDAAYESLLNTCRQLYHRKFGQDEQLFPVLHGLFRFYVTWSEHNTSRSLG